MPTGETYIIPTKLDSTGVKQGASDIKSQLLSLAQSALPVIGVGTAVSFVADQMAGAVQDTMAYAKEVRGLALASGTTAEEASRLIQVLDDYGVTTDSIFKATKRLTDEGYAPTMDTIVDLAGQYQSLTSAQERNDFILRNLGKDVSTWNFVLSQNTALLREQSAAVSDANILTEEEIVKVREAELAMDAWNDAIAGVKTELAVGLMPALTQTINGLMAMGEAQGEQVKWWEYIIPAVGSVHSLYIGLTASEEDATMAAQAHAEALAQVTAEANDARLALQGLDKEMEDGYWHQSGGFTYQGAVRNTYPGVPNRASGGPVIAGAEYNVAEFFQPEVFTPSVSGRVDPMRGESQTVVARLDEERLARIIVSAIQQGAMA